MLDSTKPLIGLDELQINNEEIKKYIKGQGVGLTIDDVKELIDVSDKGIQISEDSTYEPLDTEV